MTLGRLLVAAATVGFALGTVVLEIVTDAPTIHLVWTGAAAGVLGGFFLSDAAAYRRARRSR